jgi:hypothetical protein
MQKMTTEVTEPRCFSPTVAPSRAGILELNLLNQFPLGTATATGAILLLRR